MASPNRSTIFVFGLLVGLTFVVWQWLRTDSRLRELEEQLLSQHVDRGSGDSELSVVSDSGSLTHASPASLQALTTTTAQLRQQVQNLQTELASLKQVTANNMLAAQRVSGVVASPFGRKVEHWTGGNKRDWGHEQAAGAPDTGQAGDVPSAWAPKDQNGGEEWLQLDYDEPMDLSQINVVESHNAGAISKVTAIDAEGKEVLVWEGQMDTSETDELITSEFPVSDSVSAKQLKVYLDTSRVSGWNEIDAVQMVGGDGKKQWASGSSASSSFAD